MGQNNRRNLLRMIQGEEIDSLLRYYISYSVDIRGRITVWSGFEFSSDDMRFSLLVGRNPQRVCRDIVPVYDYQRLSPYTARIFQQEQDIEIPDETLIEAYKKFREERPSDGYGLFSLFCGESEGQYRIQRTDEEELRSQLLVQEREDILNLYGVDCPPDINDNEHYGQRLDEGKGQVSKWFQEEFERIGGDYSRLFG